MILKPLVPVSLNILSLRFFFKFYTKCTEVTKSISKRCFVKWAPGLVIQCVIHYTTAAPVIQRHWDLSLRFLSKDLRSWGWKRPSLSSSHASNHYTTAAPVNILQFCIYFRGAKGRVFAIFNIFTGTKVCSFAIFSYYFLIK